MKSSEEILQEFSDKLNAREDSIEKVNEIASFLVMYGDAFGQKIFPIIQEGVEISKRIGYREGEIISTFNEIFSGNMTGGNTILSKLSNYSVDELEKMIEELKGSNDLYLFGKNLHAYFYWFRGDFEKGFSVIFDSLKLVRKDSNPVSVAWLHYALGVFYFDTKDIENALLHFDEAMSRFQKNNFVYGVCRTNNNLAAIALQRGQGEKAYELIQSTIAVYESLGHHSGLSRSLNDLGVFEKNKKSYFEAIKYLKESLALRYDIKHFQGITTTLTELGETYLLSGETKQAEQELLEALRYARMVNSKQKEIRIQKLLSDLYKKTGDTEKALFYFEEFYRLKTELMSDEAQTNIKKIQNRFEKEKVEKEAEIERLKTVELKKAYDLIEQKNKDIHDSIQYAKIIQQSILPSKEELNRCFDDCFVLYLPKDIVSGDFYWAINATSQKLGINYSLIAAVDCTGHGVPGAFMSMLGSTLLNQTIFNPEIIYPSDVLNFLNKELPLNLKSSSKEISIRDGMDMSLCSFDMKNRKLHFAGANNPCWIIRNQELIEIKADKQAISASTDLVKKPFSNHSIELSQGDHVYLFTDGFADQFGGEKGKKFKYSRLKELLMEIHQKPSSEQKLLLNETFTNWKGSLEQLDDVLVIGIKVP